MAKSKRTEFSLQEAKQIGEKLGINWKTFDAVQFHLGLNVELEHGAVNASTNVTDDSPILTGKVALAHLNEFPDYYTRLAIMEKEAKLHYSGEN
jgi:hypothetical protein